MMKRLLQVVWLIAGILLIVTLVRGELIAGASSEGACKGKATGTADENVMGAMGGQAFDVELSVSLTCE